MNITKERTTKSYKERLASLPKNTRENVQSSINNFIKFVREKHESTPEQICEELSILKKTKGDEEYEDALYEILQQWIDWNVSNKSGAYTIRTRFSTIRSYLYYLGVKTNPQDIKQILKFPKKNNEERYPLKKEELRDLVLAQSRNPMRQALYLACSSSGMRIGEALQIQKKDLDFSLVRIRVRIKPEYTKNKAGRTTFVTKECQEKIMTYFHKLGDNDYVFSNSKSSVKNRERTEQAALERARKAIGFEEKYSSNGYSKITTHSFRAYFFTAATRKHGENYAHKMTGHGGYLMQYDRMTDEEKLKLYLVLESDLVVFDQTKNELEIDTLRNENQKIDELQREIKKLQEAQARQDKLILENLGKEGKIPRI